jgi:hypothetical protein
MHPDLKKGISMFLQPAPDTRANLNFGATLASASDSCTAAVVIGDGLPPALTGRELALLEWARKVVRDPNTTTGADVDRLRAAR